MRKSALVPVADAMVVASYTVGGQTQTSNPVWTDTKGHYQATIKCTAIPNSVVTITVSAESEEKTVNLQPCYRFTDDGETDTLSDQFTTKIVAVTSPGNYSGSQNDTLNDNNDFDKATSFAAFSILHADFEAAFYGLHAPLTDALTVIPSSGQGQRRLDATLGQPHDRNRPSSPPRSTRTS